MVLAFVTSVVLEYELMYWLEHPIRFGVEQYRKYAGVAPPAGILDLLNAYAILIWHQPLALRIGITRSVLWVIIHGSMGLAAASYPFPSRAGIDFQSLLIHGNLCGLPGLLVIGARNSTMTLALSAALYPSEFLFFCIATVGIR